MSDIQSLLDQYCSENNIRNFEGRRGVEGLAKICNALGYQDISRYGQMPGGACLGDIFSFLEDNPGAISALMEWIGSGHSPEWVEMLKGQVSETEGDPDEYEDEGDENEIN